MTIFTGWVNFFKLRNKGIKFVIYNLISTLIFGILYWLSDWFFLNNTALSTKLNLGHETNTFRFDEYLHFSLTTQTTVGYGGIGTAITNSKNKNPNNKNKIFEYLNFMQLISIIYIFGIAFQD